MKNSVKSKKVEDIKGFGEFTMSMKTLRKQGKIMLRVFIKEFGLMGSAKIMAKVIKHSKQMKKQHIESYNRAEKVLGKVPAGELIAMSSLFLALADKYGREEGYEFLRTKILSVFGKYSMPEMYNLKELKECDGDVFDNFKKFNIKAFQNTTKSEQFNMESYEDTPDKLTIKVTSCINCKLFKEVGAPELGKFGCDHDVYGYKHISDDVQCDFRRLKTIAKGDDCCMFEFYRKGFAPDNEHLNK